MDRIFLIGFMGCGKSTVGRNLARALNWNFIDLDNYIQEKEARTISEIFSRDGEEVFRLMEKNALEAVATISQVVVATGGGAPCFHNNLELMKQTGLTIYLKLTPKELTNRLLPARKMRPLIANKTDEELLAFIERKLSEREPYYCKAAIVADATATSVDPYLRIIHMYQHRL